MSLARSSLLLLIVLLGTEALAEVPFVYVRCPRTSAPVGGLPNGDLVEMLPDTARQIANFVAPCDLIYDDGAGGERILFDCITGSTPMAACAALDPAVSFDGKTIAFSVFRGPMEHFWADNLYYPGWSLLSTEAQLHLVDVATGTVTPLPHRVGDFDFGPAFLANGRLAFTSTRMGAHGTAITCTNNNSSPAAQLFTMDLDGRNAELASHHALGAELHPYPLLDGRLAYSSWQVFGNLPFRHPNGAGTCGTLGNMFHLHVQNPDGALQFALFGQHLSDPTTFEYDTLKYSTHMAAHFLTQTTDERVWTGEYYRGNNLGLGSIVGFPIPAPGREGEGYEAYPVRSVFRVKQQVRLATWASQADQGAAAMPSPPMMVPGYSSPIAKAGKIGHPAALPNNGLMLTWGIGDCTTVVGQLAHVAAAEYATLYGDNPYCDTGIYRYAGPVPSSMLPLTHPNQLVRLVNKKEFHEFFARAVVPYAQIMGAAAPAVVPTVESAPPGDRVLEFGTPFAVLGASSLIHRETRPAGPFDYNAPTGNFTLQGADTGTYADDEICGVRILAVQPARRLEAFKHAYAPSGERVMIVGEFPVRKFNPDGSQPIDSMGNPDTSFRVRLPANFPYLMQTIDCRGLTLNTDQTWQHVRPGEVKVCNGCHVHSDRSDVLPFGTTEAAKQTASTPRLGEGVVPLMVAGPAQTLTTRNVMGFGYRVEFDRDVWPLFQSRCVSCHDGAQRAGGLRLDQPRDPTAIGEYPREMSTYRCLVEDAAQTCVGPTGTKAPTGSATALAKPNLSKWVRMLGARQSLLYWKAADRRADGYTDAQFSNDVDFGAAHPTALTADELATLGRWIDTGAGWGPDFDADTVRPTLHLVAVKSDSATLASLKLGTNDVGDGIAPASLKVCLRPAGGACTPLTVPPAALAGVVDVPLPAALTDLETEVEAEVADLGGNVTRENKTVRWLLGIQPPPIVPPEVDAGTGGGDGSDGDAIGRCGCQTSPLVLVGLCALGLRRRKSQANRVR